jgi:DNA-binding HxlR family transcriptional regulator
MRSTYRQFCAIARALDLVGQRWTLLIVRELTLRGPLTAAAIARGLPEVPMNQLTERLGRLEAQGLVAVQAGDGPARVYETTAAGRELEPVLAALARFGLDRRDEDGDEEAVLPHVLMHQLELRFDAARAGREGFRGRFELVLADPESLWSVEPGADAPARYALAAGPEGLRARAGACLDPDASLTTTVAACRRLAAGDSQAGLEVEVEGDPALGRALLGLLGAGGASAGTAAAAAAAA